MRNFLKEWFKYQTLPLLASVPVAIGILKVFPGAQSHFELTFNSCWVGAFGLNLLRITLQDRYRIERR